MILTHREDFMNQVITGCRNCKNIMVSKEEAFCCDKCGACFETLHCHDKNQKCVTFIDDCLEHFFKCYLDDHSDLHDECACKDPGY